MKSEYWWSFGPSEVEATDSVDPYNCCYFLGGNYNVVTFLFEFWFTYIIM